MMHEREKSDPLVAPVKPTNKAGSPAAEPVEGSGGAKRNANQQSMDRTQSRDAMSQARARIREAAIRNPREKLTALLRHVTVDTLRWAFLNLRKNAAVGVDGVTWGHYATDIEHNLVDLHARVQRGAYRALPSRRVFIPKADGKQRPLGIAAIEDKIVQKAVTAILTPIYEAEFLGFSYGFRPGRGQHDALDALAFGIKTRKVCWILDADIARFFDTISHDRLVRFIEHRVGDRRIVRLIQKWLKAGVLEDGARIEAEEGTPQGAVISPLLANIYLHYVYDLWANQWRRRHATGDVIFVRYADDAVAGFEQRRDAERFLADPRERLATFASSLHPDKTRLLEFGGHAAERRAGRGEGKPDTFDFLGFTHICGANRKSEGFQLWRKSSRKRLEAKLKAIKEEMRKRMHFPIAEQGRWLGSVLSGFFAYHAVPTNYARIDAFRFHIVRAWVRTLRRRGQNRPTTWEKMQRHIARYLPKARVLHPWPEQRFRVRHSRWEPYAGKRPVRLCAGGGQQ
jgi:RNA-directed DNA polymerase